MSAEPDIKKPELLMPAGDMDVLRTAVRYGADAVYIGGESLNLRARAGNFSDEELLQAVSYAHGRGVKVYVAVNSFVKERMLEGVREYIEKLRRIGPDAVIVSDLGVLSLAGEMAPEIPLHISTQTSSLNSETFGAWHRLGASRVIAARELSLSDISEIKSKIPPGLEIEAFVHGAMCISYSGRCIISSALTGRSANAGDCTHPCRWKYSLCEETRPGEYFPVFEDEGGTFIMNSRDLCMVDHIPELVRAGIDSFKVEGRMKGQLYAATVARTYRQAIDDFFDSPERYRKNIPYYMEQISRGTVRRFCTGFFFGRPGAEAQEYGRASYSTNYTFIGCVREISEGCACFPQKNKFSVGETIEIMKPDGRDINAQVLAIRGEDGRAQESAPHAKQPLTVRLSVVPEAGDILRLREQAA